MQFKHIDQLQCMWFYSAGTICSKQRRCTPWQLLVTLAIDDQICE